MNRSKTLGALVLALLLGLAIGVYSTRPSSQPQLQLQQEVPPQTAPADVSAMPAPSPAPAGNPTVAESLSDEARAARAMLDAFIEDQLTVPPVHGTGVEQVVRKDEPTAIVYEIEASGLKKDSLRLQIENGVLSLEGELETESVHSRFARSFPIAEEANTDKPDTRVRGTALQIRFPRK